MRLELWDDLDPAFNQRDMEAFAERMEQEVFLGLVGSPDTPGRLDGSAEVAGFAEVALRNRVDGCLTSPVGYLEAIYVAPEARGAGLGRQLLDAAIYWARAQGCTEFATDSDLKDEAAQRFHLATGMTETFRIVQFRREI
ncbi:MAG: aminoglycoside 6'-N-acetyltransferase I [Rhodothermales bacterium]|jgi:aminoglycoside 6'-N-acetyltransferase I